MWRCCLRIFFDALTDSLSIDQQLVITSCPKILNKLFDKGYHICTSEYPLEKFHLEFFCSFGPISPHKFQSGKSEFILSVFLDNSRIAFLGTFLTAPHRRQKELFENLIKFEFEERLATEMALDIGCEKSSHIRSELMRFCHCVCILHLTGMNENAIRVSIDYFHALFLHPLSSGFNHELTEMRDCISHFQAIEPTRRIRQHPKKGVHENLDCIGAKCVLAF